MGDLGDLKRRLRDALDDERHRKEAGIRQTQEAAASLEADREQEGRLAREIQRTIIVPRLKEAVEVLGWPANLEYSCEQECGCESSGMMPKGKTTVSFSLTRHKQDDSLSLSVETSLHETAIGRGDKKKVIYSDACTFPVRTVKQQIAQWVESRLEACVRVIRRECD